MTRWPLCATQQRISPGGRNLAITFRHCSGNRIINRISFISTKTTWNLATTLQYRHLQKCTTLSSCFQKHTVISCAQKNHRNKWLSSLFQSIRQLLKYAAFVRRSVMNRRNLSMFLPGTRGAAESLVVWNSKCPMSMCYHVPLALEGIDGNCRRVSVVRRDSLLQLS